MKGRPWTREEDEYLAERYNARTAKGIAKRFGRTANSVKIRACRHHRLSVIPGERINLLAAQERTGFDRETLLRWAERDGVMKRYASRTTAPLKWLDQLPQGGSEVKALREAGFMTAPEVARELGVARRTVVLARTGVSHGPVAQALTGLRWRQRGGRWLVNPWDVREAAKRLIRRRPAGFMTAEQAAEILGVQYSRAWALLKGHAIPTAVGGHKVNFYPRALIEGLAAQRLERAA